MQRHSQVTLSHAHKPFAWSCKPRSDVEKHVKPCLSFLLKMHSSISCHRFRVQVAETFLVNSAAELLHQAAAPNHREGCTRTILASTSAADLNSSVFVLVWESGCKIFFEVPWLEREQRLVTFVVLCYFLYMERS